MASIYTLQAFKPLDRPVADQYIAFPGNHRRQVAPWSNTPQGQWVDVKTFDASALPWAERLVSFGNYRIVEAKTARKASKPLPTKFRLGDIVTFNANGTPFRISRTDGPMAILASSQGPAVETTANISQRHHHQES